MESRENEKKAVGIIDDIEKAIDREQVIRFGSTFAQKVALMREKKDLLNTFIQSDPESKKKSAVLTDHLRETIAHSDRAEKEWIEDRRRLSETMGSFHDKPIGAATTAPSSVFPDRGPERQLFMDFLFGIGQGFYSDIPEVTDVRHGIVGWKYLSQLRNDDTGNLMGGKLLLAWKLDVPDTGYYLFSTAASEFRLHVEYKLTGSGLWGLDSSLEIWIGSGLHIPGPVERIRITTLEVNEDKSSGLGTTSGSLNDWYPLKDGRETFLLHENTTVTYLIQLQILTWAEDGAVRVDVDDFWLPSNDPNSELWFMD